jgi:hypothetical protein
MIKLCCRVALILLFGSHLSAQVRTFEDLPESKCITAEVDTTHMPDNRDQDALGWCHAYALADLMSFYSKKKISAYAIAATNYQAISDGKRETKPIYKTGSEPLVNLYDIKADRNKLCLESNFNPTNEDWAILSKSLAELDVRYPKYEDRICSASYYRVIPGIDEKNLNTINKLNGSKFVAAVIDAKCAEYVPVPEGRMTRVMHNGMDSNSDEVVLNSNGTAQAGKIPGPDLLVADLDHFLDKDEPVLVFYDGAMLKNKSGKINRNYNHVSTVIGRKYNPEKKQCEYLIRNSWGTDCKDYPPQYNCKEGNVWIPRMDLLMSAGGIVAFESGPQRMKSAEEIFKELKSQSK